ncbi:2Fe-2S iron-sulfur cluster binding domain-containing protein [Parvularcula sp. ZS-1/3]|uniref:2Fe-2S iron-sulfur cluster binding domain-containing protein n=1 Tax=Parvularcula mediterranea TaxID=2732508 RepID=A0A7Y3RM49_9PROT|nr:2Fe-2S iron-sulfur cluster binding domain-containing protein [Parvularcula mediterranea]
MVKVTFIEHDGKEHEIEAQEGLTLMEVAVKNGVPGIDADCGGACACATCHVYVDEGFKEATGEASPMEESMLDFASERQDNSRLSCQISVSKKLEGMKVKIPEFQG